MWPATASVFKPWWRLALVALLLGIYFGLAVSAALEKCNTYDELVHLPAGYSYWLYNDYRLQPENGNLPQRWAALPLLLTRPNFPQDPSAWQQSLEWKIGPQFFFDPKLGNDPAFMLLQGRAMMAILGMGLGLLVFLYARNLFGWAGGLVSLTLFVFSPSLLAHGALITSDLAASFFFLAALASCWWVLQEITPWSVVLSGLSLGGLFLAKFSAVIFFPVLGVLMVIRLVDGRPLHVHLFGTKTFFLRRHLGEVFLGLLLLQGLLAWATIWTFYGWRFSSFAGGPTGQEKLYPGWERVLDGWGTSKTMEELITWAWNKKILPESYLYGFGFTLRRATARTAFLNGEIGTEGWFWYFPYSFVVKTPLAILLIIVLALGVFVWDLAPLTPDPSPPPGGGEGDESSSPQRWWEKFYAAAPLWVFLVVFWAFALRSHLNIGERHLLPTYPPLYILAGSVVWWWPAHLGRWTRLLRGLMMGTLAWLVVETLWTWPNYLAYFNQIVGGPREGYKHLVDSSLDWGQDLPGLKKWLDEHRGNSPVLLSYFGTADPGYYLKDIEVIRLPLKISELPTRMPNPFVPGIYCISATHLQGVYVPFGKRWNPSYEELYQKGRLFEQMYNHPKGREEKELSPKDTAEYLSIVNNFQSICFSRLCNYLRQREPDAQVGYSILIYRLSEEDLREANLLPLQPTGQ